MKTIVKCVRHVDESASCVSQRGTNAWKICDASLNAPRPGNIVDLINALLFILYWSVSDRKSALQMANEEVAAVTEDNHSEYSYTTRLSRVTYVYINNNRSFP